PAARLRRRGSDPRIARRRRSGPRPHRRRVASAGSAAGYEGLVRAWLTGSASCLPLHPHGPGTGLRTPFVMGPRRRGAMGGARQGRREPSYSVDTGAAERVANYHSAIGNLVAILTLTAYLNWSSVIFLTGVELDQLARQGPARASRRCGRCCASDTEVP